MAPGWWNKLKKGFNKFANDFKNGFKHGWNKTKSVLEKVPLIGGIAKKIPKFDNSNNDVTKHFGGDGYVKFDKNGNQMS